VCRDTAHRLCTDPGASTIANLDRSSGPGSHWVAMFSAGTSAKPTVYLADSFAAGIPRQMIAGVYKAMGPGGVLVTFDAEGQTQKLAQSDCGVRALWALSRMGEAHRRGDLAEEFERMGRGVV